MFLLKIKFLLKLIEFTLNRGRGFRLFRNLLLNTLFKKLSTQRLKHSYQSLSLIGINKDELNIEEENNHYLFIMVINLYMSHLLSAKFKKINRNQTVRAEKKNTLLKKKINNIAATFFKKNSTIYCSDNLHLPSKAIIFMPHLGAYQLSIIHFFTQLLAIDKNYLLILIVQDEEHEKTANAFNLIDSRIKVISDKNSFIQIRKLTNNTKNRVSIVILYDIHPVIYKHRERVHYSVYSPFFNRKAVVLEHVFKFGKIFKIPIILAHTPISKGKFRMMLEENLGHQTDPEIVKEKAMTFLQKKIKENPLQWKFLSIVEKYAYLPWQERDDIIAIAKLKQLNKKLKTQTK